MSFWAELKRRRVIKVVVAYAMVGLGVGEGANSFLPQLGAPDWVVPVILAMLVLGFPVPLVLAWAYDVTPDGIVKDAIAPAVLPSTNDDRPSVAVLPLANMSGNPENEFFRDGVTEDILTHLSRVKGLRVTSRTSVMQYKGTTNTMREIARELGVDSVLEGSIRVAGGKVRVTVQLIDAAADDHLWADSYDESLEDVFAIQSDVARRITPALRAELTEADRDNIEKRPTHDIEAYRQSLKGRFFWAQRNESGLRRAIDYFQQALTTDPTYALAYAGIADCYNLLPCYGSLLPSHAFPKAKAAAHKALALDDTLAEAHKSLAFANMLYDWDWVAADREFKRALELNESDSATHHWYFEYLVVVGRLEDAMREVLRAYDLDPLSLIHNSAIGWGYYFQRQYDRAIEQLHRALEMAPDFIWAHFILLQGPTEDGSPRTCDQ